MNLDFLSNENNTIETDTLSIKNHAISTQNDVIQIDNISMMTKAILKFTVSWKEIVFVIVMLIMFPLEFIPNLIPIALLALYGFLVYKRYEKYTKTRYYIEFNLGSSKNSYLFFEEEEFRNRVYEIIKKSFGDKNQITFVDIKHQQIGGEQNIFEREVSQTTVSGNDNIVGTDFGSDNTIAINGDNAVNSSVNKNSSVINSDMHVEVNKTNNLPWDELSQQLQQIVDSSSFLSEQTIDILQSLLQAAKAKDESRFVTTVKENSSFFDQQFAKDLVSGVLGGVISTILTK